MIKQLFIIFAVMILLGMPCMSHGQVATSTSNNINLNSTTSDQYFEFASRRPELGNTDPRETAKSVVNILIAFVVLISIVLIMLGIYKSTIKRKDGIKRKSGKILLVSGLILLLFSILAYGVAAFVIAPVEKPVIYLYPEKIKDITVRIDYQGKIIADYPEVNQAINGWKVTAFPNGKIINQEDSREYSYLFWEGRPNSKINWDLSVGFVVKGEDTREFLQKTLAEIGLTPKEYNEFIVYWYPRMKDNKYNLIHFADKQYTDTAQLNITPKPDSMLRVFMVYKPLSRQIIIKPQKFKPFERKGFTVVEWGGTEAK